MPNSVKIFSLGVLIVIFIITYRFLQAIELQESEKSEAIPNTLTDQEIREGWKLLFDGKTTRGWRKPYTDHFPEKGWLVEDGSLIVLGAGGGDIITVDEFSNFELKLDFKLTDGANSGIKYFVVEKYEGASIGLEYQILDDARHPDASQGVGGNRSCASLYDLIPAENKTVNPVGEWNTMRLIAVNNHVEHWLNGKKVVDYERGIQIFRALIQKSKYKNYENFGMWEAGHILLQDHGHKVYFRNIKIRSLP